MRRRAHVVLAEPIDPTAVSRLEEVARVTVSPGTDAEQLRPLLVEADALIVRSSPVPRKLLSGLDRLRVIGRHGAGVDNIDLDAAASMGIAVVNAPSSNTESVAEYVVLVAQLLLRRILDQHHALTDGTLSSPQGSLPGLVAAAGLVGADAAGKTLGLVGAGRIGQATARRALAVGMQVAAYDPFADHDRLRALGIVSHGSLARLLESADVVSLHVPGAPSTRGLIGAEELATMRPGAYLINVARGDVVDAQELRRSIEAGHLGGAAVDVFDPEPPPVHHPLLGIPGILVTPHVAGVTEQSSQRMANCVVQGVLDVLAGDRPANAVVWPHGS